MPKPGDRPPTFCEEAERQIAPGTLLPYFNTYKMPKRKRDDGTEGTPEKSPEPVADPKQKRLQLKLHQATVKLGHAFKVAKGFERQKLGRRQKTAAAAKNEKDAQRVETEIAALKVRE